jgi:hypothetical protein
MSELFSKRRNTVEKRETCKKGLLTDGYVSEKCLDEERAA